MAGFRRRRIVALSAAVCVHVEWRWRKLVRPCSMFFAARECSCCCAEDGGTCEQHGCGSYLKPLQANSILLCVFARSLPRPFGCVHSHCVRLTSICSASRSGRSLSGQMIPNHTITKVARPRLNPRGIQFLMLVLFGLAGGVSAEEANTLNQCPRASFGKVWPWRGRDTCTRLPGPPGVEQKPPPGPGWRLRVGSSALSVHVLLILSQQPQTPG